jgi:hypothetical protein
MNSPMAPQRIGSGTSILVLAEGVFIDNAPIEIFKQPRCDEGL